MDFINLAIDVNNLPSAEEISLQPVQPVYKRILLIEWTITSFVLLIISIALIFFVSSLRNSYGWMIVAATFLFLCVFYYVSIQKLFRYLAFAVRTRDVIYQRGWITRSIKICPFNRIQNCSVQTGPLERRYGLASLIVYTAGSESADLKIPGLLHEEAEKLRHFIMEKIHLEPDATV